MPYKNPQNKQQWEREHREQRNAQRRQRHPATLSYPVLPQRAPDPDSATETGTGWKIVTGIGAFVLVVAFVLLGTATPLPHPTAN
jgi:hypothetical protein